ncbi:unnamed protein product, partial [Timema podura]|nr:unnamed protein product [Timema podura]
MVGENDDDGNQRGPTVYRVFRVTEKSDMSDDLYVDVKTKQQFYDSSRNTIQSIPSYSTSENQLKLQKEKDDYTKPFTMGKNYKSNVRNIQNRPNVHRSEENYSSHQGTGTKCKEENC